MAELTYYSDLPPDELVELLTAALDNEKEHIRYSFKKDIPEVGNYFVELRAVKYWSRNSKDTERTFSGQIRPSPTGSIIQGRFKMPPYSKVYLYIVAIIFIYLFSEPLLSNPSRNLGPILCVAMIFLGVPIAFYCYERWLTGKDEKYMRAFLAKTFEEQA